MKIGSPEAKLPPGESSVQFLDRLSSQPIVSENDAMRGVLLLVDGKDDAATLQHRLEMLQQRKIVPTGWDFAADRAVTKGRLAYMVYQACRIPGGVVLTLSGPSQRYCLRELQYQGFVSPGATYSKVTGMEFVAIMTRADAFLETGEVPEIVSVQEGR